MESEIAQSSRYAKEFGAHGLDCDVGAGAICGLRPGQLGMSMLCFGVIEGWAWSSPSIHPLL